MRGHGKPPATPAGWEAHWSETYAVFFYSRVSSGEWFWELDVPVLQASGLLPRERLFTADVQRAYKRVALRLHPDKGGDGAAWSDAQGRFQAVLDASAGMADVCLSAVWAPCWDPTGRRLA